LEIVLHGYHTRMLRENGLYEGVTKFIGFIDDALRRYEKEINSRRLSVQEIKDIVTDLEEKLRIVGRKLSWDKAYVSEVLSTILGEIFYGGVAMANGLKAFVAFDEVEEKLVEDLSSLEGNYASKAVGCKVAGASEVACMYSYIHNTMKQHYRFGVRVGDNERMSIDEYCVWCLAPLSYGGAGMRTPIELGSTETGNRTTAGVGNLCRLGADEPTFIGPINQLLAGRPEPMSPMDFLRDPTQYRVQGPRIRTQRVPQHVRDNIQYYATSPQMTELIATEAAARPRVEEYAKQLMNFAYVDKAEVEKYYKATEMSQIDSLVTKICTSDTVKSLIPIQEVHELRKQVRTDARECSLAFRYRLLGMEIPKQLE
jgi:hypothetical protein